MNITSLLITLVGILIMVALYIMSRIAQNKLPKKNTRTIPTLRDNDGNRFTSVLDDIPATDGSIANKAVAPQSTPAKMGATDSSALVMPTKNTPKEEIATAKKKAMPTQSILFISSADEKGLDGNLVLKALKSNGLVFGEMDIFHYMVNLKSEKGMTSLFRVANGLSPWTLTEEDLVDQNLAGLSIVMQIPSKIDDTKAIETFIRVTENLCESLSGVLKNQQQQPFTPQDKLSLIASIKKM